MTTDRVSDDRLRELLTWLGDDTFAGFKRTCNLPVAEAKALVSELLALRAAVALMHEEAEKDNAPFGRSDGMALNRIRIVLTSLKENHPVTDIKEAIERARELVDERRSAGRYDDFYDGAVLSVCAQLEALAPPPSPAIKPLQWSSEAPYGVARVPKLGLMYSTEAIWYEGIFEHVELLGSASGRFPTVASARAAAQADYEARILAALDSPPDHGGGEGWVLVPREPTMAMMAAGADRVDDSMAHANAVYRAMLTSLPTQESEDGR